MPAPDSKSLTEALIDVATDAITPNASLRHAGARTLFDYAGCVIAGSTSATREWPYDQGARLALWAHIKDQDDFHLGSMTHPGGVVWSGVLACGLSQNATLRDSVAAAAFGYELTVRLGEAAGPEHRRHWHVTTTAGIPGVAGAAALLLGLERAQIVSAVSHGLSVAGGSPQAIAERTGTRFFNRIHACLTGMQCAYAAKARLSATRRALESGLGVFATDDLDAFGDRLLSTRELPCIAETGFRMYAATGFAHAAIDAALELGPFDPTAVDHISVRVSPAAAALLASNPRPTNDEEAWWSIEHAVAVTLSAGPEALRRGISADPSVRELCMRVHVEGASEGWEAKVVVRLTDGSTDEATVKTPFGHGVNAASDSDLKDKWMRLTGSNGDNPLHRLLDAEDDAQLHLLLADVFAAAPHVLRGDNRR